MMRPYRGAGPNLNSTLTIGTARAARAPDGTLKNAFILARDGGKPWIKIF